MTKDQLKVGKEIEAYVEELSKEKFNVISINKERAFFKVEDGHYSQLELRCRKLYPVLAKDFLNMYLFNINSEIYKMEKELSEL